MGPPTNWVGRYWLPLGFMSLRTLRTPWPLRCPHCTGIVVALWLLSIGRSLHKEQPSVLSLWDFSLIQIRLKTLLRNSIWWSVNTPWLLPSNLKQGVWSPHQIPWQVPTRKLYPREECGAMSHVVLLKQSLCWALVELILLSERSQDTASAPSGTKMIKYC